jgi:hypothetical protein
MSTRIEKQSARGDAPVYRHAQNKGVGLVRAESSLLIPFPTLTRVADFGEDDLRAEMLRDH